MGKLSRDRYPSETRRDGPEASVDAEGGAARRCANSADDQAARDRRISHPDGADIEAARSDRSKEARGGVACDAAVEERTEQRSIRLEHRPHDRTIGYASRD